MNLGRALDRSQKWFPLFDGSCTHSLVCKREVKPEFASLITGTEVREKYMTRFWPML